MVSRKPPWLCNFSHHCLLPPTNQPPPPHSPALLHQVPPPYPHSYTVTGSVHQILATTPTTFAITISEKVDSSLEAASEPVQKGHQLQNYVVRHRIQSRFLSEQDRDLGRIDLVYLQWEHQDQLLLSWLQ